MTIKAENFPTDEGLRVLFAVPAFADAFRLQVQTVQQFHALACEIGGADCPVSGLPADCLQPQRNFFSTCFLGVTRLAVGASVNMELYAMVNQAMRVWVTACDNILDDEYKETFPFALEGAGPRMRSVLSVLLADRIVNEYVAAHHAGTDLGRQVGRLSLAALMPSARQECEEETRPVSVLSPDELMSHVHQRKTGDLFAAPLALPFALEPPAETRMDDARTTLVELGMACQILDDVKDMPEDIQSGRHNLVVSLQAERCGRTDWLEAMRHEDASSWTSWERFPDAVAAARRMSDQRFERSFTALAGLGVELSAAQQAAIRAQLCALLRVPISPE